MKRPVILGGGVAGIAAAVRLAERGAAPLLIESRPYLGGRVRSFVHEETGDEIDNGQHLLMGCYRETLSLLERLGTRSLVELQPALHVEFRRPGKAPACLAAPPALPAPLNVAAAMLRFSPLSLRERLALLRAGLAAVTGTPSPQESAADWLHRLGQSAQARRHLWDPIILATLNTVPEQASAQLLVQVLRLGFMGRGDSSRLALPRAGLSALLAPARAYITERGGEVLSGNPVRSVGEQGGSWRVGLRDGRTIETAQLVSALPWRSFRSLFASHLPELPAVVRPLPHNPIISLYFWFDRPLDEIPTFAALIDTQVQWVFNRRKIVPQENERYPGLLSCVISAPEDRASDRGTGLLQQAEKELRSVFPSLNSARVLTSLMIAEKQATFAATPQAEVLRPPPGRVRPGLFLAGDWTATGLPGTIEGGVRSGIAAAEQVRI